MILNICAEVFLRLFLELFRFFIDHWLIVLIVLGITSVIIKKTGPLILGLIASTMDIAIDLLFNASFGASVLASGVASIAIGILWASIILFSPANTILKFINIPFMFFIGIFWGFLPIPIPLALILGFCMRFKIISYIIAVLPSILIIGYIYLAGPTTCSIINETIKFIS